MIQKNPTVTFDANHHHLDYKFEFNLNETIELRRMLRGKRGVNLCDLRRVALWKLDRVVDIPDDVLNDLDALVSASSLKIDSPQSKNVLTRLVECAGVGFPMASAFLKFLRPDVFPIIDVRAYRALFGRRLRWASYNLDVYLEYAARVKAIASTKGIPLYEVDERLYRFDQEHNGRIDS